MIITLSPADQSILRAAADLLNKIFLPVVDIQKEDMSVDIAYPLREFHRISQVFGVNAENYRKYGYEGHFGVDIAAPHGSEILAVADGEVTRSGYTKGNGNFIELRHEWGSSLYLHMKLQSTLKVGDKVVRNQVLGQVGNTGYVIPAPSQEHPLAGTHLHFSMKIDGEKNPGFQDFIDPQPYLDKATIIQ